MPKNSDILYARYVRSRNSYAEALDKYKKHEDRANEWRYEAHLRKVHLDKAHDDLDMELEKERNQQ